MCMTILEKARKDVDKFPSTASNADTKQCCTQYFIIKILNKLNAYIELSDYQVAAMLLKLPARIMSDTFIYSDPHASISLRNCMSDKKQLLSDRQFEKENDRLDWLETLQQFGATDPFHEETENCDETQDSHETEVPDKGAKMITIFLQMILAKMSKTLVMSWCFKQRT